MDPMMGIAYRPNGQVKQRISGLFTQKYLRTCDPAPLGAPPPLAEAVVTAKAPKKTARDKQYQDCLANALGSIGTTTSSDPISDALTKAGQATTAAETAAMQTAQASALAIGKTFSGGTRPSVPIPTNAQMQGFGTQVQSALNETGNFLKNTGYLLGGASVVNGYLTGGWEGAGYSLVDFGVEAGLSAGGPAGAAAAIGYAQAGGSQAAAPYAQMADAVAQCNAAAGLPTGDF